VSFTTPDRKPSALRALSERLAQEEEAYADALAELDRLAELPAEASADLLTALEQANALPATPQAPAGSGLNAFVGRRLLSALGPLLAGQARFDAALVRLLNLQVEQQARLNAGLRLLAAGLVRWAQRVEPMMDARDRARVAEAPTDAHAALAAQRDELDAVRRRTEALLALRDRVEAMGEELRALRAGLRSQPPEPEATRAALRAAEDSTYTAFENRFRGERAQVRVRQADYVELFRGGGEVLDLGCGRGEFLDLLREAGIRGRGVEGNANAVAECRARGHQVVAGDLLQVLGGEPEASLGGLFASQVVEHLKPPVLQALLAEAHRVLAPGGSLVLETVNPASALAFLDVFLRDLTHERPLHPETLRFMAAAAGFVEARIELRSPVPEDVRLTLLPSGALPPAATRVVNENAERLNALLFAPLDYALIARR
jgi:O-antigen chain-terminating methyltransferase